MKNIFLICCLFMGCFSTADAQLDVLKVQVESLASYQFDPYQTDEEEKLDSMYRATGKNLMNILDEREITEKDEVKGLYSLSSEDGLFKVYSFFRKVNGSMAGFYCSVAQWTKPDGTYGTFPLYSAGKKKFRGVYPRFYAIKKLRSKNKDLYLLMGRARASGSVSVGYALVAQLKGQYLILDYPAFYRESSVLSFLDTSSGGAPMEYDEHQQILKLINVEERDDIRIISDLKYKEITDIAPTPELLFHFDGNIFRVN